MTDSLPTARSWLLLAALAVAVAFFFQGSRGLYETTEGRYGESAREMLETGNYLEPTLNYQPHWTKPPLAYWAIAGGMRVFGVNEWGARIANSFAFLAAVGLCVFLGRTLWGPAEGFLAGLIYLSSPFPAAACTSLSTDTILTLWELLAVTCYWRAVTSGEASSRSRWVVAMWLAFGLGFLTKGPPALLPLMPIVVWHILRGRPVRLLNVAALAAFAIVGFSWYLVVIHRHPGLLGYFVGDEIIGRVASNDFHRNAGWYKPFTVLLPPLALGGGWWLYAAGPLFWKRRLYRPRAVWAEIRTASRGGFLLLWLLLPLMVFSLSRSRLPLYVLPLYPAIALAAARWLTRGGGAASPARMRRAVLVGVAGAVLLVAAKGVGAYWPDQRDMRPLGALVEKMSSGGGSEIIAFNESELYGLQFYLGRSIRRFTSKKPEGTEEDIDDLSEEMRTAPRAERYLIVVMARKKERLESVLSEAQCSAVRRESAGNWLVYEIRPAPR